MGKTILASLLALASMSSGIVASPTPRPSTVERSSAFPVDDTFKWVEGSGFHLVQCSPLPSSAEQTWLSAVIYCEKDADCSDVKHVPEMRDICVRKSSNITDDYEAWPISDWIHCRFEERGWFSWMILKGARLVFPGDFVGLGELGDPKEGPTRGFDAFIDYSAQGAGPSTHKCLQKYYFTNPESA